MFGVRCSNILNAFQVFLKAGTDPANYALFLRNLFLNKNPNSKCTRKQFLTFNI